jgi:uncharacterized membrane protein
MSTSKNHHKKDLARQKKTDLEENGSAEAVTELLKADPSLKTLGKSNLRKVAVAMEHYSGQLPHPKHLREFNELIPNGAERIMALTEQQTAHRISNEKNIVKRTLNQSSAGQWMAFILAILAGAAGFYLTMQDHPIVGGAMIAAPVMGMIKHFLFTKPNGSRVQ